jgi:hypothetical protein
MADISILLTESKMTATTESAANNEIGTRTTQQQTDRPTDMNAGVNIGHEILKIQMIRHNKLKKR